MKGMLTKKHAFLFFINADIIHTLTTYDGNSL